MFRCAALKLALPIAVILLGGSGCTSAYKKQVGADREKAFTRIFLTDFNTSWVATLEALKSSILEVSNREAGYIQTKFKDNTSERNFVDSYGPQKTYLRAQYRFKVTVSRGFYEGRKAIKVSVFKDQLVENDVLEGWRQVPTDSIEENTLLYRIGRIIMLRSKLNRYDEERTKKAIEDTTF